jgi:vacuolar-type H+-ATPase subunit D/Vma8
MADRVPTGRAGRLRLIARIDAAKRAFELLDRKHRLLVREQQRLLDERMETEQRFVDSWTRAKTWQLRVGMLGGDEVFRRVGDDSQGDTTISIEWTNTMGIVHPKKSQLDFVLLSAAAPATSTAALLPAIAAFREALLAASNYAVAFEAHRRILHELVATRARRRAIERHLLPVLQQQLAALEFRLDESDREERVAGRWVKRRQAWQANNASF